MFYSLREKYTDNLLVLLLVFTGGGLLFVFNRNLMYYIFTALLVIVLLLNSFKLKRELTNSIVFTTISILSLFIINFFFAVSEQSLDKYLYYLTVVLSSVMFYLHFKNNRGNQIFLLRLNFILKMIFLHALVNFIAYFFLDDQLFEISSEYYSCKTYNYLFYYASDEISLSVMNLFGVEFCRNQGLFWEPGVLQIYLNLFFFLQAFILKQNRWLFLIGFVILGTYSTTGILILIGQLVYLFIQRFNENKLFLPIIFLSFIPIYFVFSINVEEKLRGNRVFSFQKRLFDFTQPLFIAASHPLTGVGLDLDQFQKLRYEFYIDNESLELINETLGVSLKAAGTNSGSANSLTFLIAAMGFPTGILFVFMFLRQKIINDHRLIFYFIVFASLMAEPLFLRPFFFCIYNLRFLSLLS
ncbi:O-antigen ligase family protein [Flavobacteriales bacterium]|nr:O-antigen ligase family protein [Flavobacteriales bacterium]